MTEISSVTPDLQASTPEVRLSLTRAGVTGVQKAVRVSHEGHQTVMAAEIECTVDLSHSQKGVHMSRFAELFEEAIEAVVGTRGAPHRVARRAHRPAHRRPAERAPRRGEDHGTLARAPNDTGEQALDAGDGLARRDRGGNH